MKVDPLKKRNLEMNVSGTIIKSQQLYIPKKKNINNSLNDENMKQFF